MIVSLLHSPSDILSTASSQPIRIKFVRSIISRPIVEGKVIGIVKRGVQSMLVGSPLITLPMPMLVSKGMWRSNEESNLSIRTN